MHQGEYGEDGAAERGQEGHREETSHPQHFFRTKASYTMSPTFQDIRVTKTLAFRGLPHILSILVAQRPPNTDLSLHLHLSTPPPLSQQWMGEYTRPYIEELIGRTSDSGPVSSFAAFVRLLVGALHHQSQEEEAAKGKGGDVGGGGAGRGDKDGGEGGRIEWPTPEELEGRLQAARRRKKDSNAHSATTTVSASSSKRYLILTHVAGAARVHYPLPLRLLLTSSNHEIFSPGAASPSPSSPRPYTDATAAGQMRQTLQLDLLLNDSDNDSKGRLPSSSVPPPPPPRPLPPAPAPPPSSAPLAEAAHAGKMQQTPPLGSSNLRGGPPPTSPSLVPSPSATAAASPARNLLERQRSSSAEGREGGSESSATQAALRRAKEAAYQKKIQELEVALLREKREVHNLHRTHMKEMADLLRHQEKCSCSRPRTRSQVLPITDVSLGGQSAGQAHVLEEGGHRGQGQAVVPPAHSRPAPSPAVVVRERAASATALLPYLLLFLLLALAIVLIIVLAHGLML